MSRRALPPLARAATAGAALLWASIASAAAQAPEGYAWTLEDASDGCQVGTAPVAGKEYVAAKAVCVVPAGVEVVAEVLRDVERFPEWMEDCSQTKLLRVVDRDHDVYVLWFRQHVALFSDRDMVLRSELVHRDERRRVIRAASTADVAYDSGKGYVRMPAFSSEWVLEKVDEGRTRVSFTIDPDLGAGLPVGIANATIKKTPLRSLAGLARMARQQRYVDRAAAAGRGEPAGAAKGP